MSLGQGLFFLVLLGFGKRFSSIPARYLIALLVLLMLTNFDYLLIAGEYYRYLPRPFGISNGLMLLMGPVLYLYSRALVGLDAGSRAYLHFIPYLIFFVLSMPMFIIPAEDKVRFIETFVSGQLGMRTFDYIAFVLQIIQLSVYLFASWRMMRTSEFNTTWIRSLVVFLTGYGLLNAALVVVVFTTGTFSLIANYSYSLGCSFFLYFITGYALLNPDTAFEIRKKSRRPLENPSDYVNKLQLLLEKEKIFLKPEIKLQDVALMVGLTPHQLSQLVNEQFGKNFSDLINYYRIEEFKSRLKDASYDHLTLVGLAFEIGFNSKTSFNNTFKKFTGVTPSEFKKMSSGL